MFQVMWTDDGWKTGNTTVSRGLGSAGFSADITPAAQAARSGGVDAALAGAGRLAWIQCESQD